MPAAWTSGGRCRSVSAEECAAAKDVSSFSTTVGDAGSAYDTNANFGRGWSATRAQNTNPGSRPTATRPRPRPHGSRRICSASVGSCQRRAQLLPVLLAGVRALPLDRRSRTAPGPPCAAAARSPRGSPRTSRTGDPRAGDHLVLDADARRRLRDLAVQPVLRARAARRAAGRGRSSGEDLVVQASRCGRCGRGAAPGASGSTAGRS